MCNIKDQIVTLLKQRHHSHKEALEQEKDPRSKHAIDLIARIREDSQLIELIDSLPEEKPSEDLEEAAARYERENRQSILSSVDIVDAFIAGAEWQKEQKPADYEAMADLERTYFSNPDKLPKWLKDDIARKELNAHTKGYNKGYKDAEKRYNESVAYHFPIMPTPPSGWGCDGTHCTNPHGDCINCPRRFSSGGTITTPNTSSGTSTATLHGNTSATDGKEHNPSFTD